MTEVKQLTVTGEIKKPQAYTVKQNEHNWSNTLFK